jgi:hypothetical protein
MKPFRLRPVEPLAKHTPVLMRKHKDGTCELILCVSGSPIRCFGIDEDQAYARMAVHIRTY